MMGNRLGQQVVETSIVAALGGGFVDLEQRFGLGPADRLMIDRTRGQNSGAPGCVIGIERAGKMHAAAGRRALAGDHAVAHDGKRLGRSVAAGRFKDADRIDAPLLKGSHNSRLDLYFGQDGPLGMNEQLTIRNSHTGHFTELSLLVTASRGPVRAARIAASGGGLKVIKGNIAAAIFTFVPPGPGTKT